MAEKLGLPLAGGKEPGEDSERRGVSEAWVLTGCEGAEGKRCGRKCAKYGDQQRSILISRERAVGSRRSLRRKVLCTQAR